MRQELVEWLTQFGQGAITAAGLHSHIDEMLKSGRLRKDLSPDEAKAVNDFFAWYLDFYDPNRPPRPGLVGKLRDTLGQFKGDYRVSEAALRRRAEQLRQLLMRSSASRPSWPQPG